MFGNVENGFPAIKEYIIATIVDTISKHNINRKRHCAITSHSHKRNSENLIFTFSLFFIKLKGFEQGRFAEWQIATFQRTVAKPVGNERKRGDRHGSAEKIPVPQPNEKAA